MAVVIDDSDSRGHIREEHYHDSSNNNALGTILGFILAIILLVVLFQYGLPILRNARTPSAPQINVPGKIDVNINQPGK